MKKQFFTILGVLLLVGLIASCDGSVSPGGKGSLSPPSWIQGTWKGSLEVTEGEPSVTTTIIITYAFTGDNVTNTYEVESVYTKSASFKAGEADDGDTITEPVKTSTEYKVKVVETDGDTTTISFTKTSATKLTLYMVSESTEDGTETETLTLTKQ